MAAYIGALILLGLGIGLLLYCLWKSDEPVGRVIPGRRWRQ